MVERLAPDRSVQRYAEYDLGQAVAHLTVQAHALGLHVRQMGGFHTDVLARELGLRAPYEPFVVVAVGRATPAEALEPAYAARDTAPRERLPLETLVLDRA